MLKTVLVSTALLTLAAGCDTAVRDTSFEHEGTLNCASGSASEQTYVVGTARNPARCGPQTQPLIQ